ncbi:unnamed protein product [Adineta steineri]|uniref:Reverse transcriptase domain-containing protein n=1 Tax=Adineta steineri TaxID=433720 RepID=A0A814W1D9_9BILA|nr:unnamed protein product [Adineta steineri]CAF1466699.1 unnamed protein product [Adineta steineri]
MTNSSPVATTFIDVKAVFNQLWFEGCVGKLKRMGIPIDYLRWIYSWLTDRRTYVEIGDYEPAAGDTNQQVKPDEVNTEEVLVTQDVQDISDDQQIESNEPAQYQRKSSYHRRSRSAKIRHNRKHARQQKKHRFDHPIRRKFYYRFKSFMIRKTLRLYQIPFVHMKKDRDDVVVGLQNEDIRRQADHDLGTTIFHRRSFYYYKNKYQW